MRKILFLIILVLISSSIFAEPDSTHLKIDISNSDQKASLDSMYFELQIEKVKLENEKQNNELKSEMNAVEKESLEADKSTISLYTNFTGITIALLSIFATIMIFYSERYRRMIKESERKVDEGLVKIKDEQKKELMAVLKDVTNLTDKSIKEKEIIKDIKNDLEKEYKVKERLIERTKLEFAKDRVINTEERLKLIDADDAEKAIDAYEKLIFDLEVQGLNKDLIPISLRKNIGLNYLKLNNFDSAERELELYLTHYPKDSDVLFSMGFLFLGRYDNTFDYLFLEKAKDKYTQVVAIEPMNEEAIYNLGLVQSLLFNRDLDYSYLEKAEEKFSKVVEINPNHPRIYEVYFNWGGALGNLFEKDNLYHLLESSIDKYKEVIKLRPENDLAYSNWSYSLIKLFRRNNNYSFLDEGIEKAKLAIQINENQEVAYINWGVALILLFSKKKEIELLKTAIEKNKIAISLNQNNGHSYFNIACAYALLGEDDYMSKNLKVAIHKDSKMKQKAREEENFEKYLGTPEFDKLTLEESEE